MPKQCKKTRYVSDPKLSPESGSEQWLQRSSSQVAPQMTVKAAYKDDMIKFRVPISSGLLELENEVAQRLGLKGKRLILKYNDEENDLLRITCDDELHALAKLLASKTTIKLLVELACE